jgi:hypothetical protein
MNGDLSMSAVYLKALKRQAAGCVFAAIGACVCTVLLPGAAAAQYTLTAENGDTVQFESAALRIMLDTARALYADLEQDPHVAYMTPVGYAGSRINITPENVEDSYPWNVVTVVSDSVADARPMPSNTREADRAYYNYVVQRMRVVRGSDPDLSCDSLLALEEKAVGSFIDGWILSRTLYGGRAFATLDELVFARRAGMLRALLARRNDPQLGACAARWADENPARIAAYEAWRIENFPEPAEESGEELPADSTALPEDPASDAEGTSGP